MFGLYFTIFSKLVKHLQVDMGGGCALVNNFFLRLCSLSVNFYIASGRSGAFEFEYHLLQK